MAANDPAQIAAEIEADPESVGVTPAEDRDDDAVSDAADDGTTPLTWGAVWSLCNLSGVISETQAATALNAHPDSGYRTTKAARKRVRQAVDEGVLVSAGGHGEIAVEEDSDEHV